MKVKFKIPLLFGAKPFVVFVNGEKTLTMATKKVFVGSKPVPEAATWVFEEFA